MTQLLNIGSIQKVEITLAANITLGTPNTDNEVSVTNSGSWEELPITQQSASFNESEKAVVQGILYVANVKWKMPKVETDTYSPTHTYSGKQVVLRLTDANGTVIIVGSSINPVYIYFKRVIPAKASGYNGYEITVKHSESHSAYFVA